MTRVECLKLIAAARMLWPSWRDAPTTDREVALMGDAWQHILDDIPAELAMTALTMLAAEGREFVPPVGVIRRHAILARARAAGELPPGTDQAWREILTIVRAAPDTRSDLSHPCVHEAATAVGWFELRHGTNQDAARAHFVRFYTEAVERFERDIVLSPTMRASLERHASGELGPGV